MVIEVKKCKKLQKLKTTINLEHIVHEKKEIQDLYLKEKKSNKKVVDFIYVSRFLEVIFSGNLSVYVTIE